MNSFMSGPGIYFVLEFMLFASPKKDRFNILDGKIKSKKCERL